MINKQFLGVIQFIHPGSEHRLGKDGWTPWNRSMHQRKFLLSSGSSVGPSGDRTNGDIVFWGEWEAPSRRVYAWDQEGTLPQNLVVPVFPGKALPVDGLQNTDPYVFGDAFKYTLCKQSRRTGKSTFLANLAPGTLILFGSKVRQKFALDTAFVVDENPIAHSALSWKSELSHLSDVYRSVTLEPMYWDKNTKPETVFRLYTGAKIDAPVHGMHSFFPCIKSTVEPTRFARPSINLPGIINHALMMGEKRTEMNLSQIEQTWKLVASQVLSQELSLGLSATEPTIADAPTYLWPH